MRSTPLFLRGLRLARMGLHLFRGLATLAFVFPRVGTRRRDQLVRAWARKVLSIFSFRHVVEGPPGFDPHAPGRLYIGNHISWMDIYAIQAVTAARFVAKAELAAWPVLGQLIRRSGTVFIERGRRSDTLRINRVIGEHLKAGEVIAVFPEGTTSDGRGVLKFHANLLQAALDAQVPIVPFCLAYRDVHGHYTDAPAYIGDLTFWQSVRRVLRERRLVCEITFFEPLATEGRDRRALAQVAQTLIAGRLAGHTRQDR